MALGRWGGLGWVEVGPTLTLVAPERIQWGT